MENNGGRLLDKKEDWNLELSEYIKNDIIIYVGGAIYGQRKRLEFRIIRVYKAR